MVRLAVAFAAVLLPIQVLRMNARSAWAEDLFFVGLPFGVAWSIACAWDLARMRERQSTRSARVVRVTSIVESALVATVGLGILVRVELPSPTGSLLSLRVR